MGSSSPEPPTICHGSSLGFVCDKLPPWKTLGIMEMEGHTINAIKSSDGTSRSCSPRHVTVLTLFIPKPIAVLPYPQYQYEPRDMTPVGQHVDGTGVDSMQSCGVEGSHSPEPPLFIFVASHCSRLISRCYGSCLAWKRQSLVLLM